MPTLSINSKSVTVEAGTTLLHAAQQAGEEIPTICYHDHCTANGLCRMCVVEVEGARVLQPACMAQAADNMKVQTRSDRVERARRTILEMLNSAVDLSEAPDIQAQMDDYHADPQRFPDAERREPSVLDDNPMYIRDYAKCVLCWRCVQVCADDAQYTYALSFSGRGFETQIDTFFEKPMTATSCVFCGQCVGVCPTNALKPKREFLLQNGTAPEDLLGLTKQERKRKQKNLNHEEHKGH